MADGCDARSGPERWRTRANGLTALRLVAAPACALAILVRADVAALALFAFAVLTDLADGRVARRYGETSALGGFLDHATDALFVSLATLALALRAQTPLLLPALIMAAFVQYALDSRALALRAPPRPLRASALGRWNGIAYFVLVGIPVVRDGLSLGWPPDILVTWVGRALVVTTGLSMLDRFRSRRPPGREPTR